MGFFDRFADKKPDPQPANVEPAASVTSRLAAARERLEARDIPGAMAIYEEVLAVAGDRSDVLVTISGDLGTNGRMAEIIDLLAPRYDALRHGPEAGMNLIQAYLGLGDTGAAQHVLDLLFGLRRPELDERLYGFANAIAEMAGTHRDVAQQNPTPEGMQEDTKVSLVTISKPIWFYGLESMAEQVLPPKDGRLRRVAFAQLSNIALTDALETAKKPEDDLTRLSRAIPLWLTETFYHSPLYAPIAAVGVVDHHYALFASEWTTENLRQLVDSNQDGIDYIFTGALRHKAGDYELLMRVWEVKKFRERKQFMARWTPATADVELARLHEQIRLFMEWAPGERGLAYAPPPSPTRWLATLGTSLSLFLTEKNILPKEQLALVEPTLAQAAADASGSEAASLAFLTMRRRAERLALAANLDAMLANSPLIAAARQSGQA